MTVLKKRCLVEGTQRWGNANSAQFVNKCIFMCLSLPFFSKYVSVLLVTSSFFVTFNN